MHSLRVVGGFLNYWNGADDGDFFEE